VRKREKKSEFHYVIWLQAENYRGSTQSELSTLNLRPGWGHLERANGAPAPDPKEDKPEPVTFGKFRCMPVVDGDFLTAHPLVLMEQGALQTPYNPL